MAPAAIAAITTAGVLCTVGLVGGLVAFGRRYNNNPTHDVDGENTIFLDTSSSNYFDSPAAPAAAAAEEVEDAKFAPMMPVALRSRRATNDTYGTAIVQILRRMTEYAPFGDMVRKIQLPKDVEIVRAYLDYTKALAIGTGVCPEAVENTFYKEYNDLLFEELFRYGDFKNPSDHHILFYNSYSSILSGFLENFEYYCKSSHNMKKIYRWKHSSRKEDSLSISTFLISDFTLKKPLYSSAEEKFRNLPEGTDIPGLLFMEIQRIDTYGTRHNIYNRHPVQYEKTHTFQPDYTYDLVALVLIRGSTKKSYYFSVVVLNGNNGYYHYDDGKVSEIGDKELVCEYFQKHAVLLLYQLAE